ncbi:MAG: sugar nucleotide-binding protein [Candidatus Omnitrophica bacterium]|nr:sugar nucleotide-binding protein [Candidatus Omnitrophota bacterium]
MSLSNNIIEQILVPIQGKHLKAEGKAVSGLRPEVGRGLSLAKALGNAVFISESQAQQDSLIAQTACHLSSSKPSRQIVQLNTRLLIDSAKDNYLVSALCEVITQKSLFILGATNINGFRKLEETPALSGFLQFILTGKEGIKVKRDKSVLIIGATSFFGRAVYQLFNREYKSVRGTGFTKAGVLGFDKLDITSKEEIKEYFLKHPHFDIVIYIAGEADADLAEKEQKRAKALNIDAVKLLSEYANNSKFAYISSEYIFDGDNAPYGSVSEANPINYYGRTKLEGEKVTLKNFPDYLVLRLGALYGYNGPDDKKTTASKIVTGLDRPEPLEADTFQIKHPVLLEDAAGTLLKLIDYGLTGVYQTNGAEGLNKLEMTNRIKEVYSDLTGRIFSYPIIGIEQAKVAGKPVNTHMVNVDTPRPFNEGIRFMLLKQKAPKEEHKHDNYAH